MPLTAAAYVRMSTDQQDLSIGTQFDAIQAYAQAHELEVTRIYRDAGRSGLAIAKREGMKQMLRDVMDEPRPFDVILVYDVSRWGRFQDVDAAAYYEYTCKLHGAKVVYVQEKFGADDDPMTALMKAMQRTMAAKYSRDLGIKTGAGQDRAVTLGFHMGHLPCIGLSRVAVDRQGNRRPLSRGQHKAMQSEHIVWAPGPADEVELVRRIFSLYADTKTTIASVTRTLCEEGLTTQNGRPFTITKVDRLLRNEALAGNFVWGRKRLRKKSDRVTRPLARSEGSIDPIVPADLWKAVQDKLWRRRRLCRDKEQLLHVLREAIAERPGLCPVDLHAMGISSAPFINAFGSTARAFALAGRDQHVVHKQHRHKIAVGFRVSKRMTRDIAMLLQSHDLRCNIVPKSRVLAFENGMTLRVQLLWPRVNRDVLRWRLLKCQKPMADLVLLAQMNERTCATRFLLLSYGEYREECAWLDAEVPPNAITTREALLNAIRFRVLATH